MSRFTVNGQPVHYRLDPATPLLWALRDASNLTGTKYGCGAGQCGACTVHVDGEPVRSCLVPIAALEGRFVTTIEGLSPDRSHPVQQAFAAEWAVQCGFCTPGMIMAAAALIDANPAPTDAEIDGALANLCRCGTYPRLREAVRRAGRVRRGEETLSAAPPAAIDPADASRAVPSLRPAKRR
ncbi:MAG TPA: (2Fe-2S)-binding protein [Allosphingosinicella sp.]|nr:(2Fe-2S)-binding protein [Allosphingosinicella sp.]